MGRALYLSDVAIKEGPEIDVRAWGAVGDGVTDDTVAIQNAFNYAYANDKVVCFPPGTYEFLAASMPATKNCPAIKGIGNVLIELTGDVQWTIKNGFSMEDLSFTTTYTYANATAAFYYTWNTGTGYPYSTDPRIYNAVIRNISYRQTTVTDGSERGNGLFFMGGGVANLVVENVFIEGIRHGPTIHMASADGITGYNGNSACENASFENVHGINMQRLISTGSPSYTGGYFASFGIRINNWSLINTLTQRDAYSGGARTGHSVIIGDMGLSGSITNGYIVYAIEHVTYVYGSRLCVSGLSCFNARDIKIVGYNTTSKSSADISDIQYIVTVAPPSSSDSVFTLYHVDGVAITAVKFKGTNLSGGAGGTAIRPNCVVNLSRSGKNIFINNVVGQYLNSGILQYLTNETMLETFENIVIQNCHVLDPHTTTGSGYAAVNKFLAYYPTEAWYTAGVTPMIKNLTIRNNYFGQTATALDTTQTTNVLCRGRYGSTLLGLVYAQDFHGLLCEGNDIDGWYGGESIYTPFKVDTAVAAAAGYCQDIILKDAWVNDGTAVTPGKLIGITSLSPGSQARVTGLKADPIISAFAEITKGSSYGLAAKAIESITTQSHFKGYFTFRLASGEEYIYGPYTTGAEGLFNLYTDAGEYIIAHFVGATVTALVAVSTNASITDANLKICAYPSGGYIRIKNRTAGTEIITVNYDFSYSA